MRLHIQIWRHTQDHCSRSLPRIIEESDNVWRMYSKHTSRSMYCSHLKASWTNGAMHWVDLRARSDSRICVTGEELRHGLSCIILISLMMHKFGRNESKCAEVFAESSAKLYIAMICMRLCRKKNSLTKPRTMHRDSQTYRDNRFHGSNQIFKILGTPRSYCMYRQWNQWRPY